MAVSIYLAAMKGKVLYKKLVEQLAAVYDTAEAGSMVNLLFERFTGHSRSVLLMNPDLIINEEQQADLDKALQQLLKHEPVQYITGEAWFYNLKFWVTPAVLIPRPETEELVAELLQFLSTQNNPSVLDIGTGSGCIPIATRKNNASAMVTAIDISQDALQVAKQNALTHATEIDFRQLDFLDKIKRDELPVYDAIISNPPYIPMAEKAQMDKNVTGYEPHLALFVADEQPLIFYEAIAEFAQQHLSATGAVFMETHEALAVKVAQHFERFDFDCQVLTDIPGKERMVIATRSR